MSGQISVMTFVPVVYYKSLKEKERDYGILRKKCRQLERELESYKQGHNNNQNNQIGSGLLFPTTIEDPEGPIKAEKSLPYTLPYMPQPLHAPTQIQHPSSYPESRQPHRVGSLHNVNKDLVLSTLPLRYKVRARKFLDKLGDVHASDIAFNSKGEVIIDGQYFPKSSINKLLLTILYDKKNVIARKEWLAKVKTLDLLDSKQSAQIFNGKWYFIGDVINRQKRDA